MPESLNFEHFKSAIARIYAQNGVVVGAGFLVAENCLLTCAHVVTSALGLPADTVEQPNAPLKVDFPLIEEEAIKGESFAAQVILWQPVAPDQVGEDMAVLRIATPLPEAIGPVRLAADSGVWDTRIRMFGFPKGIDNGIWVTGVLRDRVGSGRVQMDAIAAEGGRSVEKGFSGAPIWDEAQDAVVGMAIAAEKRRDTVTAAFMTPQATLTKYALAPLERQQLLALLQPVSAELKNSIKTVYNRLCPAGWRPGQSSPVEVTAIVGDLADMPEQANHEPINLFVAALLVSDLLEDDRKQGLRQWLAARGIHVPTLLDYFAQLPTSLTAALPQTQHPYLLVLVRPSRQKQDAYFVDGWLLKEAPQGDGSCIRNHEQLALPKPQDNTASSDPNQRTFTVGQIPLLVAEFLDQIGDEGIDLAELTIEIFVPLKLLNQAIDDWSIEDQFGFESPLCCECQRVVLRSYERLRNYRPKGLWQKKWAYVETVRDEMAQGLFIPMDIAAQSTVATSLKDPKAIAVKTTQGNLSTAKGGSLALLLRTATPIALWMRQAMDCTEDFDGLLTCCLQRVLDNVSQTRRDAYHNDDDSHFGKHLSLVWENPHRKPPDIDYSL